MRSEALTVSVRLCTCHVSVLKPVLRMGVTGKSFFGGGLPFWEVLPPSSLDLCRLGHPLPVSQGAYPSRSVVLPGAVSSFFFTPLCPGLSHAIKRWGPPAPYIRVCEPGFLGAVSRELQGAHTPLKSAAASSKVRTQKALASGLPFAPSLRCQQRPAPGCCPDPGPEPSLTLR